MNELQCEQTYMEACIRVHLVCMQCLCADIASERVFKSSCHWMKEKTVKESYLVQGKKLLTEELEYPEVLT